MPIAPGIKDRNFDGLGSSFSGLLRGGFATVQKLSLVTDLRNHLTPRTSDLGPTHDGIPRSLMDSRPTLVWYSERDRFIARALAATSSAITLLFALVTFYWFLRMKKRFRHMLIMLLVLGDIIRALWLLIFALEFFISGSISTEDIICQISGWFSQVGTQITDFAALFIAIQSALQILRPHMSPYGKDGLRRYRYWVYSCTFLVPVLTASLAFINNSKGYKAQGASCTLPIRPFWYRLALSWIPRYIIASIIVTLAVVLYLHVGYELNDIHKASRRSFSLSLSPLQPETNDDSHFPPHPELNDPLCPVQVADEPSLPKPKAPKGLGSTLRVNTAFPGRRTDEVMSLDVEDLHLRARRPSAVTFTTVEYASAGGGNGIKQDLDEPMTITGPVPLPKEATERRGSAATSNLTSTSGSTSTSTGGQEHVDRSACEPPLSPKSRGSVFKRFLQHPPDAYSSAESEYDSETASRTNSWTTRLGIRRMSMSADEVTKQRERRRVSMVRQMRLLFIYPMIYLLMWLIPFVLHCMQYQDKYAVNPPVALGMLSVICVTGMGAVDCFVFNLREKPWRHRARRSKGRASIKNSIRDSIFFRASGENRRPSRNIHEEGATNSGSGFGDISQVREQALERLAAERVDRARRSTIAESEGSQRMWWDHGHSGQEQSPSECDDDNSNGEERVEEHEQHHTYEHEKTKELQDNSHHGSEK